MNLKIKKYLIRFKIQHPSLDQNFYDRFSYYYHLNFYINNVIFSHLSYYHISSILQNQIFYLFIRYKEFSYALKLSHTKFKIKKLPS
jgi:hypothetical protein